MDRGAAHAAGTVRDAAAADRPPASHVRAVKQAARLWQWHADADALRADTATVRSLHAVLRAPGGDAVAADLQSMGSLLSRGGAEGGGVEHFEPVPSFHDALLIKNNFIRALFGVFLWYSCRIHASADSNCLGARAVARPVILPPYFHPCRGDAHDASLGT